MGWQMSMHGSTDHLDPEVAQEAETTLRERLAELFGGLVAAGHQGVAGIFHHSHGSPVDLAGEAAPVEAQDVAQAPEDVPAAPAPSAADPAVEGPSGPATEATPAAG